MRRIWKALRARWSPVPLLIVVLAAGPVSIGAGWWTHRPVQTETHGAINLYVDGEKGKDYPWNTCTTPERPCATIQKAFTMVPRTIQHPVTVSVAAGTYAAPSNLFDGHFFVYDSGTVTLQGLGTNKTSIDVWEVK